MANREPSFGPTGEASIRVGARHNLGADLDALLDEVDRTLVAEGVDPESHFPTRRAGQIVVKDFEGKPQDNPMDPGVTP